MTANISTKAIALAGISVTIAGGIAVVKTVSEAYLYQIKGATAEMEKARAAQLDAANKLKGTENAAAAVIAAAVEQAKANVAASNALAGATRDAAIANARGMVEAMGVGTYVDNTTFDGLTKPFLVEPMAEISRLNTRVGHLRSESETGVDRKTRRILSANERADRMAQAMILQEDIKTIQETSTKNISDVSTMLMGGINRGMGDLGKLYPSGKELPPVQMIFEEP